MYQNGNKRIPSLRPWLIALLLALLTGCAGNVKPTDEEEQPQLSSEDEDCTLISGQYSANPKTHGEVKGDAIPLLAYTLLPATPKLAGVERVTLKIDTDNFTVTAFVGEVPLLTHAYQKESGVFECIAGSLEFMTDKKPGAAAAETVPGIEWKTIRLRKTVDGSLLLQKADGLASLAFLLFPLYLSDEDWYLFKPVE